MPSSDPGVYVNTPLAPCALAPPHGPGVVFIKKVVVWECLHICQARFGEPRDTTAAVTCRRREKRQLISFIKGLCVWRGVSDRGRRARAEERDEKKKSLPPTLIAPLLVGFGAFRIAAGFVAVPAFC